MPSAGNSTFRYLMPQRSLCRSCVLISEPWVCSRCFSAWAICSERYTRKKSLASLADQLAIKVDQVWVRLPDGQLAQKQLKDLSKEDLVVVRSGSVIPVDGVVVSGDAAVNQATMTE